jgi:hypothetical protein
VAVQVQRLMKMAAVKARLRSCHRILLLAAAVAQAKQTTDKAELVVPVAAAVFLIKRAGRVYPIKAMPVVLGQPTFPLTVRRAAAVVQARLVRQDNLRQAAQAATAHHHQSMTSQPLEAAAVVAQPIKQVAQVAPVVRAVAVQVLTETQTAQQEPQTLAAAVAVVPQQLVMMVAMVDRESLS